MVYKAPSKEASEFFGINIHDDWGLINHDMLQKEILPTGVVQDGYNEALVEEIASRFPGNENYTGFERYHIALGMVSQFCYDDIVFFLTEKMGSYRREQILALKDRLEFQTGFRLFWVPSVKTIEKIYLSMIK
jgi:hypothetical protein